MSFATTIVALGGGVLNARWTIEGIALEFVTDPAMEKTTQDGRVRLCCVSLASSGFSINERVNIPEALLEQEGTTLTLTENVDEDLANIFHHRPSIERYCTTTFDEAATTITLISTNGITAGDVLHAGTEAIKVGAVASPKITGCTRAYWGTIARKHWSSDTDGVADLLFTDRPMRVRGRRVVLALYGDDDDLAGDGTEVWRGVVASEPRLTGDGARYQLSLAGNAALLDQQLGGDLADPVTPRGIYYHSRAALYFVATEVTAAGARKTLTGMYTGFSETQEDFLAAVNAWLVTVAASAVGGGAADCTYEVIPTVSGWALQVIVGATTVGFDWLRISSEQDGFSYQRAAQAYYNGGPDLAGDRTLTPGATLTQQWETTPAGAQTVPRGFVGESTHGLRKPADEVTAPYDRVYVSSPVASSWRWCDFSVGESSSGQPIFEVDTATDSIRFKPWFETDTGSGAVFDEVYNSDRPLKISIMREMIPAALVSVWYGGNAAQLMIALTEEAIEYGELGTSPFIVGGDLGGGGSGADLSEVIGPAAILPWQRVRRYRMSAKTDLLETWSHELRAIGCYPITDAFGRLSVKRLLIPSAASADIVDITEEVLMVDDEVVGLSDLVRGNQTINAVLIHTGYDWREDEWTGSERVIDRIAQAYDHQERVLEIETRASTSAPLTTLDAAALAAPVLTLFGYPHDFWTPKVPWTLFGLRLGSPVTFDASHLPDYATGDRPIADMVGIVVGRKWAFDEAYGELQILVPWLNVAGYSPTARVLETLDLGGNLWELTVDSSLYAPTDDTGAVLANADTFFDVDDRVRIYTIDSETASPVLGIVTATDTTTHVITVQFDGVMTPSGDQELIYAPLTDSTLDATQEIFAAFAGADDLLGPDDDNPRNLS